MPRFVLLALALLSVAVCGAPLQAQEPADPPPLHSEKGLHATIEVELHGHFHRLVLNGTLWGTQFNDKFRRHYADDLGFIVPGCPWDMITAAGANATYNPRHDPLTYYHRTGPVGAMFRELRTRKNGAEATAPIGILSLGAGTEAAYALPVQSITYYESDPALKRLVADSDKYFTFIADARERGATIDIRIGKPREKLLADKDRKYPFLIVDMAPESYPIPREIMTREAVELYFDRMTEDGILSLHISNKYIHLEPMLAQMVKDLKLEARLWSDNQVRGRPGKTHSSWVVLAKSEKALGTLALPEDQQGEYGTRFVPLELLPHIRPWTDKDQDVWILWFNKDLQELRRVFGLPTPLIDGEQ